jgi:Ca-activated chloride channel family protein
MSFQWPYALVALAVIPLVVYLYVRRDRARTADAARFGNTALLPNVVDRAPGRRRHLPLAILLVALAAMIVGVARPHATVTVRREEATVILAIDVSRSMRANDVKPTRLGAARAAAIAHRQRAKDGTVPPTAVLLISDGAREGGQTSPQAAARQAKSQHVPVYTVVLGTDNGSVRVPLTGGYTAIVRVPPRPDTLRELAQATGGRFFTATDDKRLRQVYERLGSRLGHRRQPRELTDVFAGGSVALLLAGGALSALWFRRVP